MSEKFLIDQLPKPFLRRGQILVGKVGKGENMKGLYLNEEDLRLHTMIFGATGSGKTVALAATICQAIWNGWPIVLVDPKFDTALIRAIQSTAYMCGRLNDVQIVNPFAVTDDRGLLGNLGTCSYNPLDGINNEISLTAAILAAGEKGGTKHAHWEDLKKEIVSTLVAALLSTGKKFTFEDMYMPLESIAAMNLLISESKDEHANMILKDWLSKATGEPREQMMYKEMVQGAKMFFRELGTGVLGKILNTTTPDCTMKRTYAENRITIFILPALTIQHTASALGKLLLSELKFLTGYIQAMTTERKPFLCVVDEQGCFAFESMVDMYDKGRSSGLCMLSALQTPRQLDRAVSREFRDTLLANIRNKFILAIEEYDIAKYLADLIGKDADKVTYRVGDVSMGEADSYRISPTDLTDQKNFEAIFRLQGDIYSGNVLAFPTDFLEGKDFPCQKWTPTLTKEGGINLFDRIRHA